MQKVSDTLEEQKGKVEKLEIGIAGAKVVINRVGKTAAKHEKKIKKNTEKAESSGKKGGCGGRGPRGNQRESGGNR